MKMSYDEETEQATASYRCTDPIQNFKIRVVLKPVKSRFLPIPLFDQDPNTSTSDSPLQTEECDSDVEEYIFSWQEKVFSKSEIEKFSDISNCKTQRQEKYHEDIKNLTQESKNLSRKLFSYVDADNFKVKDEDLCPVYGSSGYVSLLAKKINNLEISGSVIRNYKCVSKNKIVNYSPSDDFKKQHHFINTNTEKMFLMVDLGIKESEDTKKNSKSEEIILCKLMFDPVNKVLKMSPPFSKETASKPYRIGFNGQYSKSAYHYWLYHASLQPSEDEISCEKRIRNKVLQHQMEMRKLQVGNEFHVLSPNHINVTILGEIVTARDFEYDKILVHYVVNLPPGWQCPNNESLTGTTHTSRTNDDGVAHFCQLFTVELMFDLSSLEDYSAYLPEIFFEVLSVDRWGIYRNEGYSFITLPRKPGIHNFTLKCWRAGGNSIKAELDRFFLGGSEVLEDITYAGMGARNEKKRVMSRLGINTIPSGSLKVKLNIIHQSEAFKTEKDKKSDVYRSIFGRFDTSKLIGNVNAVLEAFREARERMLKAKETLETDPD